MTFIKKEVNFYSRDKWAGLITSTSFNQVVHASCGSSPSNRIWNNTTVRSLKQQISLRTALCGGWCRCMALRSLRVACQKRRWRRRSHSTYYTSFRRRVIPDNQNTPKNIAHIKTTYNTNKLALVKKKMQNIKIKPKPKAPIEGVGTSTYKFGLFLENWASWWSLPDTTNVSYWWQWESNMGLPAESPLHQPLSNGHNAYKRPSHAVLNLSATAYPDQASLLNYMAKYVQ